MSLNKMKNDNMSNIIFNNQINLNINNDFFNQNNTYFLLSIINGIEEIKYSILDFKYKALHIGSIKKEDISLKIICVKIYCLVARCNVKLKIDQQLYSLVLNPGINFTFDHFVNEQTNKNKVKLNCFDIYEEFYIYSRLIPNYDNKSLLINKALNIFETNKQNFSFSFFINILIYSIENQITINEIEKILLNIKEKGDLTKIYKKDLVPYIKVNKISSINDAFIILTIYKKNDLLILFKEKNIFTVLNNYPNLFLHSLQLFPDFSFLIKKAESINDLKIILKCSIGLFDMISIINENKEYIMGNIIKNKSLIFYEFIGEKTFSEPLDQNIYSVLNNIKEYEKKNKSKILESNMNDRLNMIRNTKDIVIQIRILLFEFLIENFIEKGIIYNILSKKKKLNEFNNFELILLIDMLLHNERKDSDSFKYFIEFINKIEFKIIDDNFKSFFSKNIKWDIEYYILIIKNTETSKSNNGFILFLIDTLIINSIKIYNFKKIYDNLYNKKDISGMRMLLNLLNKYIISDNDLFLKDDSFYLIILKNLYDIDFFKQNNNSIYSETTITKLKNIFNRITNIKDLSYNDLKFLKNKNRIYLFLLLEDGENCTKKVNEIVNENIKFIEQIFKRIIDDINDIHFSSSRNLLNHLDSLFDNLIILIDS